MDLKAQIGRRMKRARSSAGLNQEALAEALGRFPRAISSIESGRALPSLETLNRAAKALNKPLTFFFAEPKGALADPNREKAEREIELVLDSLNQEDLLLVAALLKGIKSHRERRQLSRVQGGKNPLVPN